MNNGVHENQPSDCLHLKNRAVIQPPGSRYYATLVCDGCGMYIRPLPKPATVAKRNWNQRTLAWLLSVPLTPEDRRFLESLTEVVKRRLAPWQEAAFLEIAEIYSKGILANAIRTSRATPEQLTSLEHEAREAAAEAAKEVAPDLSARSVAEVVEEITAEAIAAQKGGAQ